MDNILEEEKKFQDSKVTSSVRAGYYAFYKDNKETLAHINNHLNGVSGKILVLGCGDVDITLLSKYKFNQIVGIDISPESVKKINLFIKNKGLGDKIKCFVMDAHNLEFSDKEFDIIFGTGILHHLNIEKASEEMRRVLKDNGEIIFMEPLGINPVLNWHRKRTPEARTEFEHPLRSKDFKTIKKYFSISTKGFYLFTILSFGFKTIIKSDFLYKISRLALSGLDMLLLSVLPLDYLCWITIIEGKKRNLTV